jgi:ethanolamine utilization microcompartment shell protein EutL
MTVIDEQAFFEVQLPCVGVGGVEQRAGVCDVRERVVVFFFGDAIREVACGIDVAVEDVDDAVADFLAA